VNRTALLVSALLLSLLANAAMLIAFAARPTLAPPEWRHVFDGPSSRAQASRPVVHAMRAANPRLQAANAAATRAQLWSALQSDDLRTLIAQLRAAGFPPLVVRAIITAQIDARLLRRADELFGPVEPLPFWKPEPFNGFAFNMDSKKSEAFWQLYRERSRQLRELLGHDIDIYYADVTLEQRRRFGDLSPAKIDRVQRIVDDYDEMMSQVRAAGGGVTLPEDRQKFKLLEEEKRADLAALLTPPELEDYEMRNHYITSRLRGAMTLMDATEEEFRAIFRAQKAYQDRLQALRPSEAFAAGAYRDEPSPMELQLQQDLKAVLGAQRYAEFARANTGEFQLLTRIAQRENIPAETTVRVFSLRDGVAQESNRIYSDAALTLDQKRTALQTLAQQTRSEILSALGPTAGPTYVQSARWLTLVERGNAVTFGPENRLSSKKLSDAPKN
jgi:hypothetical protein